ncbi:MAG: hypothetical protein ACI9JY_003262, partial [Saprospiraceae bacterium]
SSTFKAKNENKISLSRNYIYLFRVSKNLFHVYISVVFPIRETITPVNYRLKFES